MSFLAGFLVMVRAWGHCKDFAGAHSAAAGKGLAAPGDGIAPGLLLARSLRARALAGHRAGRLAGVSARLLEGEAGAGFEAES